MRKLREFSLAAICVLLAAAACGQNIPDIRDSLELADPPGSVNLTLAPFAAAILLIAMLIWMLRRRARSRAASIESPEACAERRLANIVPGGSRAFYSELHHVFVEYLETRVLIKATRCTTPELLVRIADLELMSADWRSSVETFLADCDQAKFSPSQPDREAEAALAECRALILQVAAAPRLAVETGRRP
jgi:hypothetical protein